MAKNTKKELPIPSGKQKMDAFTRISGFMTGKAVTLTSDEETILHRWIVCDGWMRQNSLTTDEICDKLRSDFKVSQFTALQDIKNAQKLFAMARSINKQYTGHLNLERINKDIQDARDRLFWYEDDETNTKVSRIPDAKELAALAKLYQAYNEAFKLLPDEQPDQDKGVPVFNFNLMQGQQIIVGTPLDQALMEADQMLLDQGDEIDFEMLPPKTDDDDDN